MTLDLDTLPKRTHTVVQFTDTHLTGDGPVHGADSEGNLRRALDHAAANVEHIDALLFTGDLADTGRAEAYRIIREIVDPVAERLGVPAIFGIGNHDERTNFRAVLLDGQPCPSGATAAPYVDDQPDAPIDYTIDIGGLRFVMLDSTVPGEHCGVVDDHQLAWLRDELAVEAAPTIVTLHHPPFAWDAANEAAWMMASATFQDPAGLHALLGEVDQRAASIVLAGHYHEPMAGRIGNLPLWAGASTAMAHEIGEDTLRFVEWSAYTTIDIFDDRTAVARNVEARQRPLLVEISIEELKAQYFEAVGS